MQAIAQSWPGLDRCGLCLCLPMSTVYLTRDPGDSSGRPVMPRRWHCGYSFPALVGRQNPAFILACVSPSCVPAAPAASLRSPCLLHPIKGLRERESGELSASGWVTSSSLRGCLAWIHPAPAVSPSENENKIAYSEKCAGCLGVAKPVDPPHCPSALPLCLARWQWSSGSPAFAWTLTSSLCSCP